ncbi:MAG: Outer membrane efflux protein [Puniceicoccaceae bacterium 5H]|nr:MAG: Outer membrane efflux protein [Puniceicoccaceae bacterium 5H]
MLRYSLQNTPLTVLSLVSLAALTGCTIGPAPEAEDYAPEAPAAWAADDKETAPITPEALNWLSQWHDPQLSELVMEALRYNRDLATAAARVEAAAARARRAGANLGPSLDADVTASRGAGAERLGQGDTANRFDAGLSASWEIDLWGELRLQRDAARRQYEAAEADLAAAQISLATQVAQYWFDLIEANQQVKLAEDTLESFQSGQNIIRQRFERGLNDALDLRLARANVASARNQLAQRNLQRDTLVRSLEILLGRYPSGDLSTLKELPTLPPPLPEGLPAEILTRRPDLASLGLQLQAAARQVGAAEKAFLPTIRLTASGGYVSNEFDKWLRDDSGEWSILGGLTAPIFDSGRLSANKQEAEANFSIAASTYQDAVLNAFREVETALVSQQWLSEREDALRLASQENDRAETLAWDQYQRGLTTIITVLESQRRAFNSRSDYLSVRNARLQNRLDLYLALGGAPIPRDQMPPAPLVQLER